MDIGRRPPLVVEYHEDLELIFVVNVYCRVSVDYEEWTHHSKITTVHLERRLLMKATVAC